MGLLKKMIKNVAGNVIGDYLPDSITGTVADKLINEAAGDVVDKAVDKSVDKAADSLRRNPLRTPPPPVVPAPAESLSVLVAVNGTTYGPYEKATLIEMIQQGSLTRDTYVYIEGMSEWRPAGQVGKVATLFAPEIPRPAAPPVPWANPAPAAPAATPAAGNSNGFSEKLNALIASAVADGEISDLERQVLIRNAQAEGVAMDEFVMVLEARLYERRQELSRMQKQEQSAAEAAKLAAMRAAAPASSPQKRNALDRCPHCNAPVKQLATSCPECGYEYPVGMAGNQGTASERLARKIEEAREKAENAPKKGNGLLSMYISSLNGSIYHDKVTDAQAMAIKNFPVPTNKTDILDLFTTCATNSQYSWMMNSDKMEKTIAKAYKNKAVEILIKARIVLKGDPGLLREIEETASKFKIKA